MFPELAGRFLIMGPPGKPKLHTLNEGIVWFVDYISINLSVKNEIKKKKNPTVTLRGQSLPFLNHIKVHEVDLTSQLQSSCPCEY